MYKFVCLIVFSSISIANCEYGRINVTIDIELGDNGKRVNCRSNQRMQEKVIDGEEIELVANTPYDIHYMWCDDKNKKETVSRCYNQTKNQCISLARFKSSQQGTWNCSYLLKMNNMVEPTTLYMNRKYTIALCKLNFQAEETLWFTGLDPNRRSIYRRTDLSLTNYTYKYENGEYLNITCKGDSKVEIFKMAFFDASKSTFTDTNRFEKSAGFHLNGSILYCYSRSTVYKTYNYTLQLHLYSNTAALPVATPPSHPVSLAEPTAATPNIRSSTSTRTTPRPNPAKAPTLRTTSHPVSLAASTAATPAIRTSTRTTPRPNPAKVPTSASQLMEFEIVEMHPTTTSADGKNKTYEEKFSEPKSKTIRCRCNKLGTYKVTLFDGDTEVESVKSEGDGGDSTTFSYNFTLEAHDKIVRCIAVQEANAKQRIYTNTVKLLYEPKLGGIPEIVSTTTDQETTTESNKYTGDAIQSFLSSWPLIVVGCAIVITICVVACCLKILCKRKKPQPPEDYANLTSDRANNYPTMSAPNQTMPKLESKYCDPKDIQRRTNNIEPNYSEAKEPQAMGEGLYAELNRPEPPEDTYAEPYISKSELYARPIPKAERPKIVKKDDPNYSNVFGQEYVNTRSKK